MDAMMLMFLAFVASGVAVELGLSSAILEIAAGLVAGSILGLSAAPWMDFLAGFGGVVLTFLAGAEVDPDLLRSRAKESCLIGGASFLFPYLAALAYTYLIAGWSWNASLVAGCALSTTSLAVVYAVLVESGLNAAPIGKLIMAATFITDMGTVLALSLTFAEWRAETLVFVVVSGVIIAIAPRVIPVLFERYGRRVIEPEIKFLFFVLFGFMALATWGHSHAVLPVFLLGLALAKYFQATPILHRKLRVVAFGMVTPFFFLKGGMSVALTSVAANWRLFVALFLVKSVAKFAGVWPAVTRSVGEHAAYTTLLMSTGLTFGTISALFGLRAGHLTTEQYSILVSVVIATAIVPTFVAQCWFSPALSDEIQDELMAQQEESL